MTKNIDKDQAHFWIEEWQEAGKKADEDFKTGRFKTFTNVDGFLKDLGEGE